MINAVIQIGHREGLLEQISRRTRTLGMLAIAASATTMTTASMATPVLACCLDAKEWANYNECVFNKVDNGKVDKDDHKDCIEKELHIDVK
jgi:hypothetical protein